MTIINVSANSRAVLALTVLSALVAISPLLGMRPPWFGFWTIAMVIPYAFVLSRVLRDPGDRSAYSLALGISSVMMATGVLLVSTQWGRHEVVPFVFAGGLALVHLLLGYVAVQHYRLATSSKPHWRLLLRGFFEPLLYYSVLLIIAGGTSRHLQ